MSVWCRKAKALFPELRASLQERASVYQLFFDLLPFTLDAHKRHNDDALARAYGFAEWCLHQRDKELWNAAGTCFYEDLFNDPGLRGSVILWLSSYVIENCADLWRDKISVTEIQTIRKEMERKKLKFPRNVYLSRKIESL